jgi:high mobility group protein B1
MKDTKAKKVATTRVVKDKTRKVEEKDIKKRKAVLKEAKPKKTRKSKKATKAAKDPNQPKRPPTPFFLFLEQFRKTFKEDHPEAKGVAVVGKAGGEKWKEMSDFEKAPFITKAQQRKVDYDRDIAAYNKQKQDDEDDEGTPEESDKSKSEINDEDEESAEEEEEEEED